jgi:hypothetical protein
MFITRDLRLGQLRYGYSNVERSINFYSRERLPLLSGVDRTYCLEDDTVIPWS